jgi:hypothetical protein
VMLSDPPQFGEFFGFRQNLQFCGHRPELAEAASVLAIPRLSRLLNTPVFTFELAMCVASVCRTLRLGRLSTANAAANLTIPAGCLPLSRSSRFRRGCLQFFKSRTHLFTSATPSRLTVLAVRRVDSQDGQHVATPTFQDPPLPAWTRLMALVRQRR